MVFEIHLEGGHFCGGCVCWCEVYNLLQYRRPLENNSPKNDNLAKHQGKRICTVDGVRSGMKVSDVYSAMNCGHMKATKIWAGKKPAYVAEQVVSSSAGEYKRKRVQFSIFF